ncbi:MAG: hypothetical protein QXU01_02445 [Candidatus Hadarchaeales archaeon]
MRRERRRYIVVRGKPEIIEGIVGCEIIRKLPANGVVIRCRHLDLPRIRKELVERGCEVLGVSGTIKKAITKFWYNL